MATENSVSNDFLSTFIDSINVFDCCLPGVVSFNQFLCNAREVHCMLLLFRGIYHKV